MDRHVISVTQSHVKSIISGTWYQESKQVLKPCSTIEIRAPNLSNRLDLTYCCDSRVCADNRSPCHLATDEPVRKSDSMRYDAYGCVRARGCSLQTATAVPIHIRHVRAILPSDM